MAFRGATKPATSLSKIFSHRFIAQAAAPFSTVRIVKQGSAAGFYDKYKVPTEKEPESESESKEETGMKKFEDGEFLSGSYGNYQGWRKVGEVTFHYGGDDRPNRVVTHRFKDEAWDEASK